MKTLEIIPLLGLLALGSDATAAERYLIDTAGAHAFIQLRIPSLGFSWLHGRFNDFEGEFTFDPADPAASSVEVTIDTPSIDSNHQRRDDQLRGEDFLDTAAFAQATFGSTAFLPRRNH